MATTTPAPTPSSAARTGCARPRPVSPRRIAALAVVGACSLVGVLTVEVATASPATVRATTPPVPDRTPLTDLAEQSVSVLVSAVGDDVVAHLRGVGDPDPMV